jgi:hypothetical protein
MKICKGQTFNSLMCKLQVLYNKIELFLSIIYRFEYITLIINKDS